MSASDVRERADGSHKAGGPAFDLFAAKLLRPLVRPGTVDRLWLIERLARGDPRPIVSVVAPAGVREDDPAVTVGRAQWPGVCVGVGR